jgi:hypothetical protein
MAKPRRLERLSEIGLTREDEGGENEEGWRRFREKQVIIEVARSCESRSPQKTKGQFYAGSLSRLMY